MGTAARALLHPRGARGGLDGPRPEAAGGVSSGGRRSMVHGQTLQRLGRSAGWRADRQVSDGSALGPIGRLPGLDGQGDPGPIRPGRCSVRGFLAAAGRRPGSSHPTHVHGRLDPDGRRSPGAAAGRLRRRARRGRCRPPCGGLRAGPVDEASAGPGWSVGRPGGPRAPRTRSSARAARWCRPSALDSARGWLRGRGRGGYGGGSRPAARAGRAARCAWRGLADHRQERPHLHRRAALGGRGCPAAPAAWRPAADRRSELGQRARRRQATGDAGRAGPSHGAGSPPVRASPRWHRHGLASLDVDGRGHALRARLVAHDAVLAPALRFVHGHVGGRHELLDRRARRRDRSPGRPTRTSARCGRPRAGSARRCRGAASRRRRIRRRHRSRAGARRTRRRRSGRPHR